MNRAVVLLLLLLLLHVFNLCCIASGNVVLIGSNITLAFDHIEANFAVPIRASGEMGVLFMADPLDACNDLNNKVEIRSNGTSPFVLIIRGGCSFEDKVRKAQTAGFKAAIVYDNEDSGVLLAMAGNSEGIKIHAVFIAKASGETLQKYTALPISSKLWLIPDFENSAWSIMAISFISLPAMSAVLATCFFVRRHRIRRPTSRSSRVREFHGMSRRLVKAMPSLIFTSVHEDNTTATSCAICLEDYTVGDKLRVLPCGHKFHALCIDAWLTSWRSFCPMCKQDARTSTGEAIASESTPLLSSAASSVLSSFRSSIPRSSSSSVLHIGPTVRSLPTSSISFSPAIQHSFRSSPHRSSTDLRRQVSLSHVGSPSSVGHPSISPINTRYMTSYGPSPSNGSPRLNVGSPRLNVGSSSRQFRLLHCNESAGTFDSSYSLPDC